MVKVTCKRCQYQWEYRGDRTMWASCPNCKTSVRVQMFVQKEKTKIEKLEDIIKNKDSEYQELWDDYQKFLIFVEDRNPELLEIWKDKKKQKAREEAEEIFSNKSI